MNKSRKIKDRALYSRNCAPIFRANSFTNSHCNSWILKYSLEWLWEDSMHFSSQYPYFVWRNSKTISCTNTENRKKKKSLFIRLYHGNDIETSCPRQCPFVPGTHLVLPVSKTDSFLFIHLDFPNVEVSRKYTDCDSKNISFHISLNLTSGYSGLPHKTQVHRCT